MTTIYSKAGADAAIGAAIGALTPEDVGADPAGTAAAAIAALGLGTAAQSDATDFAPASSAAYPVQQVTLTGSLAYTLPVDAPADQVISVVFTQDGMGGHAVTYNDLPVTVALAAGASTTVELHPVGAGYVVRYPAPDVPTAAGRAILTAADAKAQRSALDVFRRRGTRVYIFGDSHAQGVSPQGGGSDWDYKRNWPVGANFLAWGIWLSRSRVQFWGNGAAGGERTDQIYARINQALTSGADLVMLNMGTNDARQGYPLTHTQQYYKATVEAILAAGMDLIITGVPPINDTVSAGAYPGLSVKDEMDKINAWLKEYCSQKRIPYVDVYTPLIDSATRSFLPEYYQDGVHLNPAATLIAGRAVADCIGRLYAPITGWGTASNVDATNLVGNALGLTDATSDGMPDTWGVLGTPTGGTATHTLETIAGFPGKVICVEQNANTNARQLYYSRNIASGKFAAGDLMRASIHVRMPAPSTVQPSARIAFGGPVAPARTQCQLIANWAACDEWLTSVVEFRVPAENCTSLDFYLYCSAGTGKVYFAQPTLVNLTALGITSGLE